MLVAETDENGRVIHVWIKDEGDRYPHPLRGRINGLSHALDRFNIVGAGREDVASWLNTRH